MRIYDLQSAIGLTIDAIAQGEDAVVIGFSDGSFIAIEATIDVGGCIDFTTDGDGESVLTFLNPHEAFEGGFISKVIYDAAVAKEKAKQQERDQMRLEQLRGEAARLEAALSQKAA